jgi:hypothetical protein
LRQLQNVAGQKSAGNRTLVVSRVAYLSTYLSQEQDEAILVRQRASCNVTSQFAMVTLRVVLSAAPTT